MKNLVHVRPTPHGWWDVRNHAGDVLGRFVSEFNAVEAGRLEAERRGATLVIEENDGQMRYEMRDGSTGQWQPDHDAALPLKKATPAGALPGRRLILLVEDRVDSRELYAEYLTYTGFSVVTAINGHEALRLARHLRPDLILMDLRMPGMDGLEATADLKADPDLAHIPVIAITADGSDDVSMRAKQAGCTAFIAKPALPDEVARRISEVLQGTAALP